MCPQSLSDVNVWPTTYCLKIWRSFCACFARTSLLTGYQGKESLRMVLNNHAPNFFHPILLHQQPFLYCHAMCWHTHTQKSCIGDYFLPTSLSTAVPDKDTPSPDQPKPFTLVWNSGKVWTRQCILQYNYEEPIILIIILYIIYWQRLFH